MVNGSVAPPGVLSLGEFDEVLRSARNRFDKRQGELRSLIAENRVCLFGYGGKGRTLARQIASGGTTEVIVYDSNPKVRALAAQEGFPTAGSLQELRQRECGVILGACQAQREQADAVQTGYIYYQEAAYLFDAPHLENRARQFSTWILDNTEPLYRTYLAADERSRDVLVGVLCFRLSFDPQDLAAGRKKNSEMWFDVPEHQSNRKYATFLDVGAYDGDTLLQARHRLSVTRGIAVEANTSLFDSIRQVAKSYEHGVEIMPRAAWSHACRLHFSEVRGGMISVTESEDGELEAAPIDDGIDEPVDLIKMDIEGAEIPALTGCRRILATGPDLAIAAYHRPDDLVRIPAFLERAGYASVGFDLHVGHYSDCFDDTILYYIRRQPGSGQS